MLLKKRFFDNNIMFFCLIATPLIGVGIDMYTPSLPSIARYFHVSDYAANLTLIVYFAVFGLSQPFVGILSDYIDRKKFISIFLGVYFISSIASALSISIGMLYLFRIINSISAASLAVSIKSILLDNFSGPKLAKANNYFVMSWSLTPMIAPLIGGYLQHGFGWRSSFYCIAIYSAIIFACAICFFSDNKKKNKIVVMSVRKKWGVLFSDYFFMISVVVISVENIILYNYYTVAPFVIQSVLKFNASSYGKIIFVAGLSYLIGNMLNGWSLNRFKIEKIILAGISISMLIMLISALLMHALYLTDKSMIYFITIPFYLLFICDGFVFSNVMTMTLSKYDYFSGLASGLLIGMMDLISAIVVALSNHFIGLHNIMAISVMYFTMLLFSFFLFFLAQYRK